MNAAVPLHSAAQARAGFSASLGRAIEVLAASRVRSGFRLTAAYAFLEPPIRLGQIRFRLNGAGAATGYVAWAYLTDPVLGEIARGSQRLLDLPEWNEGTRLVVMDIVVNAGGAAGLLREMTTATGGNRPLWWRRHDRAAPMRRAMLRPMRVQA